MTKTRLACLMAFTMMIIISVLIICGGTIYAAEVIPTDNQYMELKFLSEEPVEGAGTQAIFELWSYDLNFKGVDVRFSYDDTKLTPSNINTNVATTGIDCFEFVNGLDGFLELFQVTETQSNTLRYVISLNPIMDEEGNVSYTSSNSYLKNDVTDGDYVETTGGVLIGKLSFLLTEGAELEDTDFSLVTSETNSPLTGIKIAKTATDYYSNQSTFRFSVITTGTVSGTVTTFSSNEIYSSNIKAYVAGTVDWTNMTDHIELDALTPAGTIGTNNDGTYILELETGVYDILVDKPGYLDHVYTNVTILKNVDVPLGVKALVPGDMNKDGYVKIEDLNLFNQNYSLDSSSAGYNIKYDFTEDGYIKIEDLNIFNQNYSEVKEIVEKGVDD